MIELPRFVLPDNTVVRPEDVVQIDFANQEIYTWPLLNTFTGGLSFKGARTDKQSPFKYEKGEKKGEVIFENEQVKWKGQEYQLEGIVKLNKRIGRWEIKTSKTVFDLWLALGALEFVSIVPYDESEEEK